MYNLLQKFRRDEGGFALALLMVLIGAGGVIALTFYPSFQSIQKKAGDDLSVLCSEGGKIYAVNHYSGASEDEARAKMETFISGYINTEFDITASSSALPEGITINITPLDFDAAKTVSPDFKVVASTVSGSTNPDDIEVLEASSFEYEETSSGDIERFAEGTDDPQARFTLYEVDIVSTNDEMNENVASKVSKELQSALPDGGVRVGCIVGAYKAYEKRLIESNKGEGLPVTSLFWYHEHVRDSLTESGLSGNYYAGSHGNVGICRRGNIWLQHRINFYNRPSSLTYDGKSVVFESYGSPNLVTRRTAVGLPQDLTRTPEIRSYWNHVECTQPVMPDPNRNEVDGAEFNESKWLQVNGVSRGALAYSTGDRWGNTMSKSLFRLNEPEKWVFFSFYKGIPDPYAEVEGSDPGIRLRENWIDWFSAGGLGPEGYPTNRHIANVMGRGFVPGYPGKVKCNNRRVSGIDGDFIEFDVELTEKTVEEYMKKHGYVAWRASPEFVNMLASGFYAKDWPETTAELMAEPAARARRDIPIRKLGDWSNDPKYQDRTLAQKLLTGSRVFDDGRGEIWTPYFGSLPSFNFNAGIGTLPTISARGSNRYQWAEFSPWLYHQARYTQALQYRDRAADLMDTTIPKGSTATTFSYIETAGFSHSYSDDLSSPPAFVVPPSDRPNSPIPVGNGYAFDYNRERVENYDAYYNSRIGRVKSQRYVTMDKCTTRNPFWRSSKNVCALFFKIQPTPSYWGWTTHRNIGFSTAKNPAMYAEYEDCTGDGTNVPIEEIPEEYFTYSISSNANAFVLSSRN